MAGEVSSFDPARRTYKAIVIGTGAGGASAAWVLAQQLGSDLAILESGTHYRTEDFTQLEGPMIARLYAQGGLQATEDGAVTVLQGHAVGGSTLVNDGLCFRPPQEIAARWKTYGGKVNLPALNAAADEVEQRMGVVEIPREMINRANYLVGLGAARLGWKGERLRHNSAGCVQCGFRSLGCAYDAKQSTNLSFIPEAVQLGAHLHVQTAVRSLKPNGTGWRVHTSQGEFSADHVILAAGVVQTPAILLRSGFTGVDAGKNLQFHLQAVAWGDFPDPVDGHNGIPMAYGVMQFADVYGHKGPGFLIEGVSYQPSALGAQAHAMGAQHEEFIRRFRHLAGAVMLLRSSARGEVTLGPGGAPRIQYPIVEQDAMRTREFYARATEMLQAAGAQRIWSTHREYPQWTKMPADLSVAAGRLGMYTAHPFGGACVGSTLEADHRVKGMRNLWVLDGSAFPEALGVNPQITIAATSIIRARQILA